MHTSSSTGVVAVMTSLRTNINYYIHTSMSFSAEDVFKNSPIKLCNLKLFPRYSLFSTPEYNTYLFWRPLLLNSLRSVKAQHALTA